MQQTIQIWVDDQPGTLMRVAGILAAKGANIESLTVAQDPTQLGVSRITIRTELEPHLHARVVSQMNRLVNVHLAQDVSQGGKRSW